MKVIHIIETLKMGGKERQLLELTRGMIAAGADPHIVIQSNEIEYDVSDLPGRIHLLPRRSRWDLGLAFRIRAVADSMSAQVIHSWGSMCSVYAVPVSHWGRTPFIQGDIRDAPSHLPVTDKRWWHGRVARPFAAAVVGNSRAGLAAYRVHGPKGHVIYNGFDIVGRTVAADTGFATALGILTPRAVAMIARFGAHKDHTTFFAAADRILAARDDVTFLAVGDGEGLAAAQARFHGNPRVLVLGRRPDVERIVANIDLGVLFTRTGTHGEGISNALTEILAAGKPVIATDDGGNRELVGEHRCGMLVPPEDVDAATAAIAGLLNDPARAKALGGTGRRIVIEHFSRETMVAAYLRLYAQVTAAR